MLAASRTFLGITVKYPASRLRHSVCKSTSCTMLSSLSVYAGVTQPCLRVPTAARPRLVRAFSSVDRTHLSQIATPKSRKERTVPRDVDHVAPALEDSDALDDETDVGDDAADGDLNDLVLELKDCKTVQDVLEVVTDEVVNMSPEEVSFALYRVAYMARFLSNKEKENVQEADAVKALMSVVLQKHSDMNSVQACKCMWAMATLKADHNRPVVAALSQKWRKELVQEASVLDNTQFLWALGTLGSRSNDRVYAECLNDLLVRIRQQISEALRDDEDIDRCVSMAATGASKLRFRLLDKAADPAARGAFIVQLQRYLEKRMASVGGRTLANALRALADLGAATQPLLLAAAEQLAARPDDFATQERCMLIGACAAQRLHPGNIVGNTVNRALQDEELSSTSAGQLLLALARYGSAPPRSAEALLACVCPPPADAAAEEGGEASAAAAKRLPTLDALVNAAWAAGVLKVAELPAAARVCAAAAEALDVAVAGADAGGRPVPGRVLRKAYHAQMLLRLSGGELPLGAAAASTAAAEWASETWPQGHSALVQARLVRFLEAMRVPFSANVPVDGGRLRIDVQVEQSHGKGHAAVMLSSDRDYITGPGLPDWTLCGPKLREDEMLAAAGFHAVRVPASPVRHVPNAQFVLYAEKVLRRAGLHKPDIPISGTEALMEVERNAQVAKREKRQAKHAERERLPGALELRDRYAAMPDAEHSASLSSRPSPRASREADGGAAADAAAGGRRQRRGGAGRERPRHDSEADRQQGPSGDVWGGVGEGTSARDGGAVGQEPVLRVSAGSPGLREESFQGMQGVDMGELSVAAGAGAVAAAATAASDAVATAAAGSRPSGRRVVTATRDRRPAFEQEDKWGAVGQEQPRRASAYGGYGGRGRGLGDILGGASAGDTDTRSGGAARPEAADKEDDVWGAAWEGRGERGSAPARGAGGAGGAGRRGGRYGAGWGRGAGRDQ
eukprot:jgi/Ulvmu1/9695/UM055_0033.1